MFFRVLLNVEFYTVQNEFEGLYFSFKEKSEYNTFMMNWRWEVISTILGRGLHNANNPSPHNAQYQYVSQFDSTDVVS